jgi:hypothetical protein
MGWRGFGFVHRSRTIFCRAVPNPNLTIRNFFHRCRAMRRSDAEEEEEEEEEEEAPLVIADGSS